MKSFKNDIAPILFYFDVFTTEIFKEPIMPVPIRIDKVINGDLSLFINPNIDKLNEIFAKLDFTLDLKNLFIYGMRNLVKHAKNQYKQLSFRPFKLEKIFKWFEQSIGISASIPSLRDDFTFLISEFITIYSNIKKMKEKMDNNHLISQYIQYGDRVINYFKDALEQNSITVVENGEESHKMIYKEKKEKYYPEIVPVDIRYLKSNKVKKKYFVPYLIYDDIIECFSYNRILLNDNSQEPCDMNILRNIDVFKEYEDTKKRKLKEFKFQDIDVGTLI